MSKKKLAPKKSAEMEQTFIQHLIELRTRLMRSLYGVLAVFIVLAIYPGPAHVYDLLAKPLIESLPKGSHMIAVGIVSPFFVPVKVTVLLALMFSLPWVLYQVWAFVAPGLYSHEKRLVIPLIMSSTLLFYAGSAFSYFVVFKQAFPEIMRMAPTAIVVSPDIEAYLNFVLTMFLCFGLAFEVPVVLAVLVRLRMVTISKLKQIRSYYVVGAAVAAALVTPPDPISMLALFIPLVLLYELGIIGSHIFYRYSQPTSHKEMPTTTPE